MIVACTLAALTSLGCAIWLWWWTVSHNSQQTYTFFQMVDLFVNGVEEYWHFNSLSSTILLSTLAVGLLLAFTILVFNIKTYYKGKMSVEMRWLSILFAVFAVSYGLRTVYQYELGDFKNWVPSMVTRWHFVNTLPLIFDIFSIGAILIMHHLNFRPRPQRDNFYDDNIYDLMPEDVDSLDHLLPGDEYEQSYPQRHPSTLNSDEIVEQTSSKGKQLPLDASDTKWMTTRVSKNT